MSGCSTNLPGKRFAGIVLCVAAIFLFAPAEPAAQPVPGVDISPFGSQTVWPVNANLVEFLDRMQEAEIEWGRFDLCWWGLAEATPSVYNFTKPAAAEWEGWNTDRAIRLMRERGIEPFPILCYGNKLYDEGKGPYSDAARKAFGNYCHAAAEKYRDSVTYWEIWNEPNLQQFWARPPDAADYARLAVTATSRIREANPKALIAGGATSGIDLAFLQTAFQHGLLDAVDIITVHPYRIAPPESINNEIDELRKLIGRFTERKIEIWTGEWGYNTFWSEMTEMGQAKCLARMMINNLSQGIQVSIWFSIHAFVEHAENKGKNPEWGLLDFDLQPRPSFRAMQVLNRRLPAPVSYAPGILEVATSPSLADQRVEVLQRGSANHLTAAVWLARWPVPDEFAGETTSVTIGAPPSASVAAYDGLSGESIPITVEREDRALRLENFRVMDYPIYIELDLSEESSSG